MSTLKKKHSAKYILYEKLTHVYKQAYPAKSNQKIQLDVNSVWAENKPHDDFESRIWTHINNLNEKSRHAGIKKHFSIASKTTIGKVPLKECNKSQNNTPVINEVPINETSDSTTVVLVRTSDDKENNITTTTSDSNIMTVDLVFASDDRKDNFKKPAQGLIRGEIDLLNADLVGLYKREAVGMLSSDQEKELKEKAKKKQCLHKRLARKIGDQRRARKSRLKKKEKLQQFLKEHPEAMESIQVRSHVGRPRIEESQPMLLKVITDIALYGSAAHEKRQSDIIRSIKTLDELTKELLKQGFCISRSAIYLRLIPKRSSSTEGKRHVVTCPVKLIRAQNDHHAKHIDGRFCTATIRALEELASFLGPKVTCFISQDDKARVNIGLTAAKEQAPMLMNVDYKISLPDHDWVVASKHKLIPSVYAGIDIAANGFGKPEAVGYSGPTYIAIRSGKHSSSTALSHCLDIEKLIEMPEFEEISKHNGIVKPVFIFSVDGGPDENPRYEKVIKVAIHHFLKYNLDGLFIATNAPGRSAFNRVERRMAPLSRELSGLILPYEHFGSHLNSQRETVDEQLEKRNFQFSGETLAEVWTDIVIDKYPVKSEYILPECSEKDMDSLLSKNVQWTSKHVQTSQYFTQIVKCKDETCCSSPRSSIFKFLNKDMGFIPPPIPLEQSSEGVVAAKSSCEGNEHFASLFLLNSIKLEDVLPKDFQKLSAIPYDLYCPSVKTILSDRTCLKCFKYFASLVLLKEHLQYVHKKEPTITRKVRPVRVAAQRANELMAIICNEENEDVEWINIEDVDDGPRCALELICRERQVERLTKITSIEEHMTAVWKNL